MALDLVHKSNCTGVYTINVHELFKFMTTAFTVALGIVTETQKAVPTYRPEVGSNNSHVDGNK
jgi:hypothetical protein